MAARSHIPDWLSALRSYFIFDPLVFLYTAVCGALSLLLSFADKGGRKQHNMARSWSWLIMKTVMCPVEVVGRDKLDLKVPRVYAANHISALDIPLLYTELPIQFRIVAMIYLFSRPFMGWHLRRSGQIAIDPSSMRATFRSLMTGVEDLQNGLSVVIFPEGGRSPNGQLQPFQNGAFYMAIKAQAEVVPVTIVGTYEALPMNGFHIRPRRLRLIFSEPISTRGMTTHQLEEVSRRTYEAIDREYYANSDLRRPEPVAAGAAEVEAR
jgi:1-acyl-sn-glycerol-3-phosphate acyltransferase